MYEKQRFDFHKGFYAVRAIEWKGANSNSSKKQILWVKREERNQDGKRDRERERKLKAKNRMKRTRNKIHSTSSISLFDIRAQARIFLPHCDKIFIHKLKTNIHIYTYTNHIRTHIFE